MTVSRWNVCGVLRWGKDENFKNLFYIRRTFHISWIFQISFCISVRGGNFQIKQDCISVFGIFSDKNRLLAYSVRGIFQRKTGLHILSDEFPKKIWLAYLSIGVFPEKQVCVCLWTFSRWEQIRFAYLSTRLFIATVLHISPWKFSRENQIRISAFGIF